jgi:hypothetical protein
MSGLLQKAFERPRMSPVAYVAAHSQQVLAKPPHPACDEPIHRLEFEK